MFYKKNKFNIKLILLSILVVGLCVILPQINVSLAAYPFSPW
ncbi:hypothetical protein CLROS_012800 [Clostridium felsineum]|uniref:Uncharacterized protein n=1 Tax=Clostridium felsineum TaxID=36839 RepID=A0A1S8KYC2_9CLOT|nr:hypothetical protein CLROS_012800 [Clostridium felsineum]URZ10985.1 hypothetical protein CROST_017010 [Clostridium felsineum]